MPRKLNDTHGVRTHGDSHLPANGADISVTKNARLNGRPAWAEVSIRALRHNLQVIQRHIGGNRKILAIVKANAYGHGAVQVTKALARAGAHAFGVTCTSEGAELRESGIRQPILVLTGFWPGEEAHLLRYRLTPAITRLEQLLHLERAARKARNGHGRNGRSEMKVHLKVDTGMNRLGLPIEEIDAFACELAACQHVKLEGVFTHLASAEDFTTNQTEQQEQRFCEALERLRAAKVPLGVTHMANSAAITSRPSTLLDMVRPGALLYGYHQSFIPPERRADAEKRLKVQPALSLRTRIVLLREVAAGQGVGYNARFAASRRSCIAIIAAGYADGLPRQLSNRGCVLVRGRRVPVVGTVSMDLAMIDVTDVPDVSVGDVVTLYGTAGSATLPASEAAWMIGTVTSDLLCALGNRVPRFYIE